LSPSRPYQNAKRVTNLFLEHDLRGLATKQEDSASAIMQAWSKHSYAQRLTSLLGEVQGV